MVDQFVYRTRLFRPPAKDTAEPEIHSNSVGVALSGGGSRSLAASMGQLRALHHLGVMDRVWGISSVSGGTWAAVPYVYLPEKIADEQFLGMVVPNPDDLTWSHHYGEPLGVALNYLAPNNLGAIARHLGMAATFIEAMKLVKRGVQPSESWPMMIGNLVLKPFGLYEGDAEGQADKTFTWKEENFREDVEKLNPGVASLARDKFRVVEHGNRPFLITNTAVVSQRGSETLLPYEITPLAAGVQGFHERVGPGERDLGGGGISPFALGSVRAMPDEQETARVTAPIRPFSLADMVGVSSVAPAEEMQEKIPLLDAMIPTKMLWPAASFAEPRNAAWPYLFTDGGTLENTAVVALLRRRLRRVCAFLNCETPLAPDAVTGQVVVDTMLPPLFGYQPHVAGRNYQRFPEDGNAPLLKEEFWVYRHNQVFPAECFLPLINGLMSAAQDGGAAMFRQDAMKVLSNDWFGVVGGHEVDILWVYNFRARAFMQQLPWQIRLGMALPFSGLHDFPYYKTSRQMRLHPRQINLLAHLAAWTVIGESEAGHSGKSNADVFTGLFEGS